MKRKNLPKMFFSSPNFSELWRKFQAAGGAVKGQEGAEEPVKAQRQ